MKLHRFFIREAVGNRKEISLSDEKLAHQLRNVFRLKTGDSVILFDGSGLEYVSEITNLRKDVIDVTVTTEGNTCFTPMINVHLIQSLIKKDNFEWVLEKCTEIGVSEFTPLISERTEKKNLNTERAETILIEASEQSGRGTVPKLHETQTLSEIISKHNNLIAFHLDGKKFKAKDFIDKNAITVIIGPEGGWSEKEIDLMKQSNVEIYSLGKQTLRSETAAISVASLLLL